MFFLFNKKYLLYTLEKRAFLSVCCLHFTNCSDPVRDIRLKMNGTRFTDGVKVTCLADGQPSPAYRWIVKPSGATITDGAEVTLLSAFTYQCIASNEIRGQVYTETSWEIYVQPAPVKGQAFM